MKTLIYTFRTNPLKEKLKQQYMYLIIFGKLKEDFNKNKEYILREKPEFIIGCAKSDKTCFEKVALNKFNDKKIELKGEDYYELFIPENNLFDTNLVGSSSFCNWTMYKFSKLISENNLKTKLIFIHFNEREENKLINFIEGLR